MNLVRYHGVTLKTMCTYIIIYEITTWQVSFLRHSYEDLSSFFFTCVDPFSFSHNLSKITLTGDMSLLLFFSYSRIRVLYMHAAFDSLNCARYPAHGLRNQSIRKNLRCCSCAHSLSLSSSSLLLFWAVFRKRSALCLNVRI